MRVLKHLFVVAWIVALSAVAGWILGNALNDQLLARDLNWVRSPWHERLPFVGLFTGIGAGALLIVPYGLRARRQARGSDARCPACGYDLRGSEGKTCPECGARRPPNISN